MMNLEKMKQKKRTITKSRVKKSLLAATTFLCLTTPLLQTQTAYAAENTTPAITIEKPDGWKQGETSIAVTVDASHMPEGFSIAKIEAKAGKDGSWQDVTGSGSITITGNQTVYVRVTDGEGKVYEQNRSIKCYDTEKPTLSASLTDGVLTIQGNDTVAMSFSKPSVKAYVDGNVQRTENIKFNASSQQKITMDLPKGVKLHKQNMKQWC